MPHFSEDGNDEYICQTCARIYDSVKSPSEWIENASPKLRRGNACPNCIAKANAPMGLVDYCRIESGLEGQELMDYVNRHYGHG